MEKLKFEGSTLDDALSNASKSLGCEIDSLDFEVVEETKGFLGIGSKTIINASIKEAELDMVKEENSESENVSITKEEFEIEDKPVLVEEETKEDLFFDTVKDFIETTISKMGIKANLVINTVDEDVISFDIVGEDIAILIGKYGATLDSLQYLACIVANKKCPCRRRIVIDADGHRAKRTKELQERAIKIADMVVKHGREAVMEPQNAKDRRIVHMVLRNHPGVKTYSEGDGMDRHVIISPKEN